MRSRYAIATDVNDIPTGYLFLLGISAPQSLPFVEAADAVELGNGHVTVLGVGLAVWQWGFMEVSERDALRAYCPAYSAEVFIRTLDASNVWETYRAIMLWPTKGESYVVDSTVGLTINFKILELMEDVS
jgi:hypothetical protein